MRTILVVIAFMLSGCGHAWVVQQNQETITVGYRGYSSSQAASEGVAAVLQEHCPGGYREIASGTETSLVTYPVYQTQPVSGYVYSGGRGYYYSGTQSSYGTQVGTYNWHHASYACRRI